MLYFVCHYITRVVLRSCAGCGTSPVGVVLVQYINSNELQ